MNPPTSTNLPDAMRYRLGSLPLQLLALMAIPLLAFLTMIAFGGVTLHRVATRDLVSQRDVRLVRGVAASLSERLDQQVDTLARLAGEVQEGASADEVIGNLGYWPDTIFDAGLAFYDDEQNVLGASPQAHRWHASPAILDGLRQAEIGDGPVFIPLIQDGQNITRVVVIAPSQQGTYQPDSDFRVFATGVISLQTLGLNDVLVSLQNTNNTIVYLIDEQGQIIYHSDPTQVGMQVPDLSYVREMQSGASGANYHPGDDGGEVLTAFAPVSVAGWSLAQEDQWENVISPALRYAQIAPLLLLPGLLIATAVLYFLLRQVVLPLRNLENRATGLAWGDFYSIEEPVGGVAEIRRLQGAMKHMAARIKRDQESLRYYIGAITQAQEDERARLARELHDHMVQSLIVLGHREQLLKRYLNGDPAGDEVLKDLRKKTQEAVDDLRRIIRAMRPIYLEEFGLVPALEMLARENSEADLPITFKTSGRRRRLEPEQEMALYRVAQEALNNARRHSAATRVTLEAHFRNDEILVRIADDGIGFEVPQDRISDRSDGMHFGLMGMYERADLIGGRLDIQSDEDEGTSVALTVPLKPSRSRMSTPRVVMTQRWDPDANGNPEPEAAAASEG
ncbi:MAG: hypothetical protein GYB68_01255 [Chloroflexi bacterium]|nr:hypothetical protein [Chloroflexota bacterium]